MPAVAWFVLVDSWSVASRLRRSLPVYEIAVTTGQAGPRHRSPRRVTPRRYRRAANGNSPKKRRDGEVRFRDRRCSHDINAFASNRPADRRKGARGLLAGFAGFGVFGIGIDQINPFCAARPRAKGYRS